MRTLDELERSVERLNRAVERLSGGMGKYVYNDDIQLLLSERAELLATVERMRGALEKTTRLLSSMNRSADRPSDYASRVVMEAAVVLEARAALTTGEGK